MDFTAHVVGFDIDKNPKAKAQLQCLASSTGGRYVDARDANELNQALQGGFQPPTATARQAVGGMVGRVYDPDFGRLTVESADKNRLTGRYAGTAADGSDAGTIEGAFTPDSGGGNFNFEGPLVRQVGRPTLCRIKKRHTTGAGRRSSSIVKAPISRAFGTIATLAERQGPGMETLSRCRRRTNGNS